MYIAIKMLRQIGDRCVMPGQPVPELEGNPGAGRLVRAGKIRLMTPDERALFEAGKVPVEFKPAINFAEMQKADETNRAIQAEKAKDPQQAIDAAIEAKRKKAKKRAE
jgi:hypothetical protein